MRLITAFLHVGTLDDTLALHLGPFSIVKSLQKTHRNMENMALKDRGKDTVQAETGRRSAILFCLSWSAQRATHILLLWEYLQMFQVLNKNAPNIAFWIATDASA